MNNARQAEYVAVGYCPDCTRLHLMLANENQEVIAQAVISDEIARYLIEKLQLHLYHRAVEQDKIPEQKE
jgi:hypothetical protein